MDFLPLALKVVGLTLLLAAFGAETFWKAQAERDLRQLEFMTLAQQEADLRSELQFLKYLVQNRSDPRLLSLAYRDLLGALVTTLSHLEDHGARGASELRDKSEELLRLVATAHQRSESLEPRDAGRNIRHEIVEITQQVQQMMKSWLDGSRATQKWSRGVFIAMYVVGSVLVIASEVATFLSRSARSGELL